MPDTITAMNFDNAVMVFGLWAENMLEERDEQGNRLHTLEEVLSIQYTEAEMQAKTDDSLRRLDAIVNNPLYGVVSD